jgi:hypothetical protein
MDSFRGSSIGNTSGREGILISVRSFAWRLAGLGVLAVLAAGVPAAINAQLVAAPAKPPAYKVIGAHAMPTREGYIQHLKSGDYTPVGSEPFGNKMIYGGGPVLTHPKVFITYWDWHSDPAGVEPYLTGFFRGVGGSDWIKSQNQYCQHVPAMSSSCPGGDHITSPPNQLGGVWEDHQDVIPPNPIPEPVTGDSPPIADEAARSVAHFGYYRDAIYIIATPHGDATAGFATNGGVVAYCAWHGAMQLADGSRVQFVNLPYIPDGGPGCGQNLVNAGAAGILDGVSVAGGHEYAEAITDPTVSFDSLALKGFTATGWYDPDPAFGGENGDKCAYPIWQEDLGLPPSLPGSAGDITLNGKPYAVQPLWSNDANGGLGGCVLSDNPGSVQVPDAPADPNATSYNSSPASCRGAQIVDPAGDAVDPYTSLNLNSADQPALDILNVRFSTPDANTLRITTQIDNLQHFPQGNVLGATWSVYWDYAGTTYVASVADDLTGTVYEDGVHTSNPQIASAGLTTEYTSLNSDAYSNTALTGSFNTGPNGTLVIDVPRADVGSPPNGATLSRPWAVAYGEVANAVNSNAPAIPGAGNRWLYFPSDLAPDNNPLDGPPVSYTGWPYKVGSATNCSAVRQLPPPPADTLKPPPPAAAPKVATNCTPVWTDASGDDELPPTGAAGELAGVDVSQPGVTTGQDPQLDLLSGFLSTTPDGKTLRVRMVVNNLSTAVAAGATDNAYYEYFTVAGKQYLATAQVDLLGNVTYTYGTPGATGSSTSTTGSFGSGPDGVISINVPLSGIGNPKLGTEITGNGARAIAVEGVLLVDVDDAAETGSLAFDGLNYVLTTAPCGPATTARSTSTAVNGAGAGQGGPPAAANPPAAAAPAAAPPKAGSASNPIVPAPAKPSRPTVKRGPATTVITPVPAAAIVGVLALLLALGGLGFFAFRRRGVV